MRVALVNKIIITNNCNIFLMFLSIDQQMDYDGFKSVVWSIKCVAQLYLLSSCLNLGFECVNPCVRGTCEGQSCGPSVIFSVMGCSFWSLWTAESNTHFFSKIYPPVSIYFFFHHDVKSVPIQFSIFHEHFFPLCFNESAWKWSKEKMSENKK